MNDQTVARLDALADDEDDLLRDAHNPNTCDLWLSAEPERGCTCSNGDTT